MNCALAVLRSDRECYVSKSYYTRLMFAAQIKNMRQSVSKVSTELFHLKLNGNVKGIHFNTDKQMAHTQHLFCRGLFYRACIVS